MGIGGDLPPGPPGTPRGTLGSEERGSSASRNPVVGMLLPSLLAFLVVRRSAHVGGLPRGALAPGSLPAAAFPHGGPGPPRSLGTLGSPYPPDVTLGDVTTWSLSPPGASCLTPLPLFSRHGRPAGRALLAPTSAPSVGPGRRQPARPRGSPLPTGLLAQRPACQSCRTSCSVSHSPSLLACLAPGMGDQGVSRPCPQVSTNF